MRLILKRSSPGEPPASRAGPGGKGPALEPLAPGTAVAQTARATTPSTGCPMRRQPWEEEAPRRRRRRRVGWWRSAAGRLVILGVAAWPAVVIALAVLPTPTGLQGEGPQGEGPQGERAPEALPVLEPGSDAPGLAAPGLAALGPLSPAAGSASPSEPTRRRAVFTPMAGEVLGFAAGLGKAHGTHGMINGTRCALTGDGTLLWSRAAPGGAACRLVLFDRGRLSPGWRIEAVRLHLGFGTAVWRAGEPIPFAADLSVEAARRTRLEIDANALPLRLGFAGTVPLGGARFRATLESLEISGPPEARDWRAAFATPDRL